jgi:hypothetical protein
VGLCMRALSKQEGSSRPDELHYVRKSIAEVSACNPAVIS